MAGVIRDHHKWPGGWQLIQTALDLELAERTVIADAVGETACIFLAGLYRAEQVICTSRYLI